MPAYPIQFKLKIMKKALKSKKLKFVTGGDYDLFPAKDELNVCLVHTSTLWVKNAEEGILNIIIGNEHACNWEELLNNGLKLFIRK